MKLKVGQQAPGFTLPNQEGDVVSLSDFRGKKVLLYFYPRDNTPGCTTEACAIRDSIAGFRKQGLVVLGISTDSVESHRRFAEKYALPFDLLADTEKNVVKAYGVWQRKRMAGRDYRGIVRSSFLINEDGAIEKIYPKVKPAEHATEVLSDISGG